MHWFLIGVIGFALALAALSHLGARWIERTLPPVGDFVVVDGVRLHYVDEGEGPTLILLHGASSNLRDFATSLVPALSRHYRVLAFDRPGYGYSERPNGEWPDPARVAALVLDAAEQLGAERPVLLGHSWAGSVVMAALVEMPERVAAGVLLSGVAGHWTGPVSATYTVGGLPLLGRLFAHTLVVPVGTWVVPQATASVVAPERPPEGYAERIGAHLALRPRNFLHNVEDMNRLSLYMQRLSPRYRDIDRPLLLIHGDRDTLVPFWNHGERLLPVVPEVQVHQLPGAGHAPHHTRTGEVVDALRAFLDRPRQ